MANGLLLLFEAIRELRRRRVRSYSGSYTAFILVVGGRKWTGSWISYLNVGKVEKQKMHYSFLQAFGYFALAQKPLLEVLFFGALSEQAFYRSSCSQKEEKDLSAGRFPFHTIRCTFFSPSFQYVLSYLVTRLWFLTVGLRVKLFIISLCKCKERVIWQ